MTTIVLFWRAPYYQRPPPVYDPHPIVTSSHRPPLLTEQQPAKFTQLEIYIFFDSLTSSPFINIPTYSTEVGIQYYILLVTASGQIRLKLCLHHIYQQRSITFFGRTSWCFRKLQVMIMYSNQQHHANEHCFLSKREMVF